MLSYIETHINDECNLGCAGCSHFAGIAEPMHKDIGEFTRELERLAEIEEVKTVRILGGEPLLNPDFMEYLRIARRCFPDSEVCLVTNGILGDRLAPHQEELKGLRINVTISDYHISVPDYGYDTRHDKGKMYHIALDLEGKQNEEESFRKCDISSHGWSFYQDGKLYPCCVAGCIHIFWKHFGINWGIELGIDVFTHTAEEIEEYLSKPCELCRFCDVDRRSYHPFRKGKGYITEWI